MEAKKCISSEIGDAGFVHALGNGRTQLEDCFGTRDRRPGPTEQIRLWYALGLATGYQHAIQIDAFTDDKDEYNGIVAAMNTAHTDRFRFLLQTFLVPALWHATPVEYPAGRACRLVLHWLFGMPGATTSRKDIHALQQIQTSTPKSTTTSLSAATVSYATNSSLQAGLLQSMSSSIKDPVERAMNPSIQYHLWNQATLLVDKRLQRDAPLSIVWPFVYQNETLRLYAGIVVRGENLDQLDCLVQNMLYMTARNQCMRELAHCCWICHVPLTSRAEGDQV